MHNHYRKIDHAERLIQYAIEIFDLVDFTTGDEKKRSMTSIASGEPASITPPFRASSQRNSFKNGH